MRTGFLALLFLGSTAATGLAQDVQMNVRVQKVGGPALCSTYSFEAADVGIYLDDSIVALDAFDDQVVRVTGTQVVDPLCPAPTVLVTNVMPPTAVLEACGTPRQGCSLRFRITPQTIAANTFAFSLEGLGFLNLGDPLGVLFLHPPHTVFASMGPDNVVEVVVPPGAPLGRTVYFQGHQIQIGPIKPPGTLTNPLAIAFLPPSGIPCVDPGVCGF